MTATVSMRVALPPSRVMEGAMKPMMMSGTQNMMSWPMMYLAVTTTTIAPRGRTRPSRIPAAMAISRRPGRLLKNFIVFAPLLFIHPSSYG